MPISTYKQGEAALARLAQDDVYVRALIAIRAAGTKAVTTIDEAIKTTRYERWLLVRAMQKIEAKGGGRLIFGRSGHPTRLHWHSDVDFKNVLGEALPEAAEIEADRDAKLGAMVEKARAALAAMAGVKADKVRIIFDL